MALIFEKKNHIAYITINRPEAMNAMDPETYSELSQAWIEVRDDPEVWCSIVTGAGEKSFSAGADLKKTIPREPEKWELSHSIVKTFPIFCGIYHPCCTPPPPA